MSRRKSRRDKSRTSKEKLLSVQLATAKARLAKLEGELPPPATPEFSRIEDLPPLNLEERDRLKEKLVMMLTDCEEEAQREKYEWYMSMAHLAP